MKKKIVLLIVSLIIFGCLIVLGISLGKKHSSEKSNKKNDKETTTIEETTEETTTEPETEPETTVMFDTTKPMVALTFDDGPSPENTGRILDALKEHHGHATFFMVGYNMDGNDEIIKRVAEEGSEVGNHTANHLQLTKIEDDAQLDNEINSVKNRIQELTGQAIVPIRPPYGDADDRVMSHITDPVMLWSIDTLDWKTKSVDESVINVQTNIFDGAIVLMHDIYPESAEAAVRIIEWLDSQGYQMVTVSELGEYRRGGLVTGVKYGSLEPR